MQEETVSLISSASEQKLMHYLDLIAEKLGTSTEYLHEVLLRQAHVEGVLALFYVLIAIVVMVLSIAVLSKVWRAGDGSKDEYNLDNPKGAIATVAGAILFIIAALTATAHINKAVVGMTNPDFLALEILFRYFQ